MLPNVKYNYMKYNKDLNRTHIGPLITHHPYVSFTTRSILSIFVDMPFTLFHTAKYHTGQNWTKLDKAPEPEPLNVTV